MCIPPRGNIPLHGYSVCILFKRSRHIKRRRRREDVLTLLKFEYIFCKSVQQYLNFQQAKIILIDAETDGEQCDTFFIYNSLKGTKKEEKIRKYWKIFVKFNANIVSKLFSHWELQYTLVVLSDQFVQNRFIITVALFQYIESAL